MHLFYSPSVAEAINSQSYWLSEVKVMASPFDGRCSTHSLTTESASWLFPLVVSNQIERMEVLLE
jgi:hypothetical protein